MNATSPIDPLAWWKLHNSRFLSLRESIPSERVLSRAKLIQQRQRWASATGGVRMGAEQLI